MTPDELSTLAARLRVARAWRDISQAKAGAEVGVSRQTWNGYEGAAIPPDKVAVLDAWAAQHSPMQDAERARAFGMLEATERMSLTVAEISREARQRLGDAQLMARAATAPAATAGPASGESGPEAAAALVADTTPAPTRRRRAAE